MAHSIRLLIITSEFPPQPGGIGNHAYNLAKSFQNKGFDVTVLTDIRSADGKPELDFDQKHSFKVVRVGRKGFILSSYLVRIKKAFQLAKAHDSVLLSGKFSLWTGGLISVFRKKKYIAIIHGSEVKQGNPVLQSWINFSLKRCHKVIAVSNYTLSLVARLKLRNTMVIPNGFEIDFNDKTARKEKDNIGLITVGNLTKRKGQHNVIKALPVLRKKFPNLKYHLVGIPTNKDSLTTLAISLGVIDAIVFHGRVSEEEKVKLLRQNTIFTMLSESTAAGDVEGFGIAILEANALGLPAIGATKCGIEDAISDYSSGVLVDAHTDSELLKAVETIMEDYDGYSSRAVLWSENFNWGKIISRYIDALRQE